MIIKTKHNASVSATIDYNLDKEKSYELIYHSSNLRVPLDSSDIKGKEALIADFNYQVSERQKHPIGHTVINFGADKKWEQMDRESKESFCADVIKSKGLSDTQYIFVEHHDTAYKHLHLVYNKTDNFGKGIHQDKHAIDDNILTYQLGNKYDLSIPTRTKDFIDRQLEQDPNYIEKVGNRPLSNRVKPTLISEESLAAYRSNSLLSQARNEHHLGKLASSAGVDFNVSETSVSLDGEDFDREDLAAVFSSNRSDFSEQNSAIKQSNKDKELKESKPDYLQKIERQQARVLAHQRQIEAKERKEQQAAQKSHKQSSGRGRSRRRS